MNRIFITFVLYEQNWQELTIRPCLESLLNEDIQLLIYDNSLNPQKITPENKWIIYQHDTTNPGLAKAYNKGLELAHDFDLLLLLDQDTELTIAYFEQLKTCPLDSGLGAVVPTIFSGGKQISPVLGANYINHRLAYPENGRTGKRLMAINSGTALNVKVLQKLGGFNPAFPLDFLDHWLFYTLYQNKYEVVVENTELIHDLSVLHYETMSARRYRSILNGESLFYKNYDKNHFAAHKKQLLLRSVKQFLTVKNRIIWKMTWKEYLRFRKETS